MTTMSTPLQTRSSGLNYLFVDCVNMDPFSHIRDLRVGGRWGQGWGGCGVCSPFQVVMKGGGGGGGGGGGVRRGLTPR